MMRCNTLEERFEAEWERYQLAITAYAATSKSKSQDLKRALRDDGHLLLLFFAICYVNLYLLLECTSLKVMRCLAYFLSTKSKKKSPETCTEADVPFLIIEVPVSV